MDPVDFFVNSSNIQVMLFLLYKKTLTELIYYFILVYLRPKAKNLNYFKVKFYPAENNVKIERKMSEFSFFE